MKTKTPEQLQSLFGRAAALYTSDLSSTVNARYGIDKVREAVSFYRENQTAGKVLLQPELNDPNAAEDGDSM